MRKRRDAPHLDSEGESRGTRRWRFWSTRDSIDNDVPSVSAIIETILAAPIYWWNATHFGIYLPLLASVAVAPFVLLRSDESVATGAKWFTAWETRIWSEHQVYAELGPTDRWRVRAMVLTAALLAGAATHLLSQNFLEHNEGWNAFVSGCLIGWAAATVGATVGVVTAGLVTGPVPGAEPGALAMAGPGAMLVSLATGMIAWTNAGAVAVAFVAMVAVAVQLTLTIAIPISPTGQAIRILLWFSPLVVPGITLGVFLVSVCIRFVATLLHFRRGLQNLPRNFRRLVLCTSPLQIPELVPGLERGQTSITLEHLLDRFQSERRSKDIARKIVAYVFYPLTIPFWFIPGWLYRLTIKSTAWFWWPRAFLGDDLQQAKQPDEFRRKHWESLQAKSSVALSIVTISVFLFVNFLSTGIFLQENPLVTVLGYFLLIDWSLVLPWQWLTVTVASLAIWVVFRVDDAVGEYRNARKDGDQIWIGRATRKLGRIERIARFRLILSIVLWFLVGGQALLFFNSRKCWISVPRDLENGAKWAYGSKLPQGHCGDFRIHFNQ
jgi:hypothetical protein